MPGLRSVFFAFAVLVLVSLSRTPPLMAQDVVKEAPVKAAEPPAQAPAQAAPQAIGNESENTPALSDSTTAPAEEEATGTAVWGPIGEAALFTGVAGLATGAVFTILSLRVDTEAKNETDEKKRQDAVETRDLYKKVYLGCYIGGGVLALTGAMLWGFIFEEEKEKDKAGGASFRPIVAPDMVGIGGTF